jgi:hypothetical protein
LLGPPLLRFQLRFLALPLLLFLRLLAPPLLRFLLRLLAPPLPRFPLLPRSRRVVCAQVSRDSCSHMAVV